MPARTDVHVTGRMGPRTRRGHRHTGADLPAVRLGHRARAAARPAIVYFHGGGWVIGDLDTHDAPCRLLAAAPGAWWSLSTTGSAPEHPFPAAVDDAWPPTAGCSGTPTSWVSTPGGLA